jgi:hypothetical protein
MEAHSNTEHFTIRDLHINMLGNVISAEKMAATSIELFQGNNADTISLC